MVRVMVFGTFDNFHLGHLNYFWQARHFGDELVIIIARDANVLRIKGKRSQQNERQRATKVRSILKVVDWTGKVVLGSLTNKWAVLKKYRPEVIALGYDQSVNIKELKKELAAAGLFCKIKRLKAYQPTKYKSSYYRGKK